MEGSGQNRNGFKGHDEGEYYIPRLIESADEALMNFVEGRSADMGDDRMQERGLMDYSVVNNQRDTSLNEEGTETPTNATLSDSTSNPIIGAAIDSTERASDLLLVVSLLAEPTRTKILELAYSAMDELTKIALAGKPLWQPQKVEKYENLNFVEYLREFGHVDATLREIIKMVEVGEPNYLPFFDSYQIEYELASKGTPAESFQIEASRDIAYVRMSPIDVVELLMDLEQWSGVFYNIVSRAMILGILSKGVEESLDGRLQVMSAEFHLPTALVPTRECYFARYCKQWSDTIWGIVDISLEEFFPHPSINFRRRPSGCLIQEMPEGFTKITWVEHGEADSRDLNITFRELIKSGFAFGATRWVACIVRQYEYSETLKARYTPLDDAVMIIPEAGRASFLKLAERMMRSFCVDISGATRNQWMQLPRSIGSEDVRVTAKESIDEPGKPSATTLVFSTSQRLPASPRRLFDFLRDGSSRNKWDLLSRGLAIRELAYIVKGKDAANRVSVMQVNNDSDTIVIHYLQESYTDISGSYVVYAPLDAFALSALLNGGNPDVVAILPSGFAILPDEMPKDEEEYSGTGSILTVAFHIIDNASRKSYIHPESVFTIQKIIRETISAIKDDVLNDY